ncbi:hypothetical protein FS749_014391 [Ceratobasidium sp. UAMH 11750]|nr:hypothetical protein FS749_014391 [Ceratobasidium sp. UAMH 11750]
MTRMPHYNAKNWPLLLLPSSTTPSPCSFMSDKSQPSQKKRVDPPQVPCTPAASSVRTSESHAQSVPSVLSASAAPAKYRASLVYPTPSNNMHKASIASNMSEPLAKRMPAPDFGSVCPDLRGVPDPSLMKKKLIGSVSKSEELEESEFEKELSGSDKEDNSGGSIALDLKVEILSARVNQDLDFEAEDKALKAKFSSKGKTAVKPEHLVATPKKVEGTPLVNGRAVRLEDGASITLQDSASVAVKREDGADLTLQSHRKNLVCCATNLS